MRAEIEDGDRYKQKRGKKIWKAGKFKLSGVGCKNVFEKLIGFIVGQ